MKYIFIVLLNFAIQLLYGQDTYNSTLSYLKDMLTDKTKINFQEAVFTTENLYSDHKLSKDEWTRDISNLKNLTWLFKLTNTLEYSKSDKNQIETYASIFKVITDTITIHEKDNIAYHFPYTYDFDDVFAENNWSNMFVTKLLATRKGNCHSMPYLYKILCDELGVPCNLALAPNHIYVKHRSEKAGWYNTELTSGSFPIDAWLMASGYITLESIQNGIYMDALTDKQCIALCVLDLAKGFDRKYPDNDGIFITQCCDLALTHFPKCINALLFKAEIRKKQFEKLMEARHITNPAMLRAQKDGNMLWNDMNMLYTQVHQLGYRTMPEQMYVDWLLSLKKEREKYSNKQVTDMNKD